MAYFERIVTVGFLRNGDRKAVGHDNEARFWCPILALGKRVIGEHLGGVIGAGGGMVVVRIRWVTHV